jgi:hypothetical protein
VVIWGIVATLGGCGRFVDDAGTVCLAPDLADTPQQVDAGGSLTLFATGYGGCNMRDLEVQCDATARGDRVDVTTTTSWVPTNRFAVGCEAVLLTVEASCDTPPLTEGSYTLHYVDSELDFDVPGEVGGCLEGLPR